MPTPEEVRARVAQLSPIQRQVAWFVSELREAGASVSEIFEIEEIPPVPKDVQVRGKRGGVRTLPLSKPAHEMLTEWGGTLPLGARALQRALRRVDLAPTDLGSPSRPIARYLRGSLPKGTVAARASRPSVGPVPILQEYAKWITKTRKLAPQTTALYVRILEKLVEWAQQRGRRIEALQRNEVEDFVASQRSYAVATQAQLRAPLESFYEFLGATGGRSDNPAKGVEYAKRAARAPRRRVQVGAKLSKLPRIHAEMVPVVSELMEAGLTLKDLFSIKERPPVPATLRVEGARGTRMVHLSEESRRKLDEWGGRLPRGQRAFQRALEDFGVSPRQLADPLHPGLSNLPLSLLPEDSLHPQLESRARQPFLRKEFDTAVLLAMRAVEVAVRKAGGFTADDVGVSLMRKAFHSTNGPLTDPSLTVAEKEATANLFAGAIGYFKNPSSHRDDLDWTDPVEVAGVIRLADVLLRIVARSGSAR